MQPDFRDFSCREEGARMTDQVAAAVGANTSTGRKPISQG
jgi:hypothetical protein